MKTQDCLKWIMVSSSTDKEEKICNILTFLRYPPGPLISDLDQSTLDSKNS